MDHRSLDVVRLGPAKLRCGPLGLALLAAAPTIACADTVALPTFDVLATTSAGAIDVDVIPGRDPRIGADKVEPCADL
jgi:hypothetical protein